MKIRDFELKLIAELVKNSRASDRGLAVKLGVSQPTVTRIRAKLKEEGYIKEYNAIPDFQKLGFHIMALTFVRLREPAKKETINKLRKFADELLEKPPFAILMAYVGEGYKGDRVLMTLHENYSSYAQFLNIAKKNPVAELYNLESFLIDLDSNSHYLPLTFSKLADYMLKTKK